MKNVAKICKCDRYDESGEPTTSFVIPTTEYSKNIQAIDVTSLPEHKRIQVAMLWNKYQEYVEMAKKSIFSFEDYVSHTTNTDVDVKWTQVSVDQLQR